MSILTAPALPATTARRGVVRIDDATSGVAASVETLTAVSVVANGAAGAAADAAADAAEALAEAEASTALAAAAESAASSAEVLADEAASLASAAQIAANAAVAAAASFPIDSFLGTITVLSTDPGTAASNSGKWWQIGVAGTLSDVNAGGLVVAIGDRILSNGTAWVRYLTPPTYITEGSLVTPMYGTGTVTLPKIGDDAQDLMVKSYLDAEGEAVTGFLSDSTPAKVALGVDAEGRVMLQGKRYGREDFGYDYPDAVTDYKWGFFTPGDDGQHRTVLAMTDAGELYGPRGLVGGDIVLSGSDFSSLAPGSAGAGVSKTNVQETEDGSAFRFYAKPSTVWVPYRAGKSGNGFRPRYTPADLNHFILYGQSNATRAGNEGGSNSPLTTTPHPRSLMFNLYTAGTTTDRGLLAPQVEADSTTYRAGSITSFQALYEGQGAGDTGETMASGIVNTIDSVLGWRCLASSAAVGGYTIAQLAQGTFPYLNLLYQVTRAKTLTEARGGTYKVPAITFIQGEADAASSTWHTAAIELCNDLNVDIKAITGQAEDVLFIIEQMNRPVVWETAQPVDLSILNAHHGDGGRIYWQAPRYNYVMSNHYYPHGKRARGCHIGTTLAKILADDHEWEGLRLKSHSISGSSLFLRFHVPKGPLAFNTSPNVTTLLSNYGFEATGLTAVEITHDNVVMLTNSGSWTGKLVRYARQDGLGNAKGNLSDSDDAVAIYNDAGGAPYDLKNWCSSFELQL